MERTCQRGVVVASEVCQRIVEGVQLGRDGGDVGLEGGVVTLSEGSGRDGAGEGEAEDGGETHVDE